MSSTSIRVPRELRDRLAQRAEDTSASLAEVIEHALDAEEDAEFWQQVRATMAAGDQRRRSSEEAEETAGTLKDGLDPEERWDDVW